MTNTGTPREGPLQVQISGHGYSFEEIDDDDGGGGGGDEDEDGEPSKFHPPSPIVIEDKPICVSNALQGKTMLEWLVWVLEGLLHQSSTCSEEGGELNDKVGKSLSLLCLEELPPPAAEGLHWETKPPLLDSEFPLVLLFTQSSLLDP